MRISIKQLQPVHIEDPGFCSEYDTKATKNAMSSFLYPFQNYISFSAVFSTKSIKYTQKTQLSAY